MPARILAIQTALLLLAPAAWSQDYQCRINVPGGPPTFEPGQEIALEGQCVDGSGNPLPDGNLDWVVEYKVDTATEVQGEFNATSLVSFTAKPRGEGLSWYVIRLAGRSDVGTVSSDRLALLPANGEFQYVTVSDMEQLVVVANGHGPMERNTSVGEVEAEDGNPISLRGGAYNKGLGVHAGSEVRVPLDRRCPYFVSDIGVDDEKGGAGSVIFKVMADEDLLYTSAQLTGLSPVENIAVKIPPMAKEVVLIVEEGDDGMNSDHADWAGAHLICRDESIPVALGRTGPGQASSNHDLHQDLGFKAAISGGAGAMRFSFLIPGTTHAVLELRDGAGRLLARPLDRNVGPGRHDLEWAPASPLPAGLMFAVLKAGSGRSTRILAGGIR